MAPGPPRRALTPRHPRSRGSEQQDRVEVALSWAEIRASDITGRSRAFASLIEAGASFESAALVAGLELDEDSTPSPGILAS